jgi:hypothetical protein
VNRFLSIFSPTQWAILAGVLLALVAAVTAVGAKVYGNGEDAGRSEIQAKWDKDRIKLLAEKADQAAALNRSLLLQAERAATLSNALQENARAYSKISQELAVVRTRADADGRRLREQAASAQLATRVANAEREVVNDFAAGAFRAAVACRDDLAEIGLGAGGLVEASNSAHAEHSRAEALINFFMPQAPTPPTGPVFQE